MSYHGNITPTRSIRLPEAFLVYLSESPDFDGVDPVATVMWITDTTNYSAAIDPLNSETLYYWKVVPVSNLDNGDSPDAVTIWTFTTEAGLIPYPNLAVNPTPEDGAIEVSLDLSELAWEFNPDSLYTNPEAFLVYLSETPDFDGADPVATVMWEAGVTNYSASIDPLSSETLYYWKVVPVTSVEDGNSPDPVTVWTFTTEVYVFPYPNAAENPTPEDGGLMPLEDNHMLVFSWDYFQTSDHSLPDHFEIYCATYTNTVAWINPIAELNYVEGQSTYSIVLTNIPNYTYELGVDHFWKIVPVSADGQPTPDVPVWVFRFDEGNSINELSSGGTSIYPNPAEDILNIEPGFEGKYEVLLYDVQGKLVKHFSENEGSRVLNIASVQAGAYQLVVRQGNSQFASLIKVN